MGHYLDIAKQAIAEYEAKKAMGLIPEETEGPRETTKAEEREAIRQAFKRLELGETSCIRLYSRTCGGEFIVTKGDDIPDSITVNCPHFTLSELKKLVAGGANKETIRKVYIAKETFPGSKVEEICRTKS